MDSSKCSSNNRNYSGPRRSTRNIHRLYCEEAHSVKEPPPADTVCRVCLAKHLKLNTVSNDLQNIYRIVTREEYNRVGFPEFMCYICLAELRNCHKFAETARDSNRVLERWYYKKHEMNVVHSIRTYSAAYIKKKAEKKEDEEVPADQVIKTEVEEMQLDEFTYYNNDIDDKYEEGEYDARYDNPDDNNCSDTVQDDFEEEQEVKSSVYEALESSDMIASTTDTSDLITETKPTIEENDTTIKQEDSNFTSDTTSILISNPRSILMPNVESNIVLNTVLSNLQSKTKKPRSFLRSNPKKNSRSKKILNTSNELLKTIEPTNNCSECDFKCNTEMDLTRHMQFHDTSRPHVCDVCQYRFDELIKLEKHKVMHKPEYIRNNIEILKSRKGKSTKSNIDKKSLTCDNCNQTFNIKSNLKAHIKKRHSGANPFVCDICYNGFITIADLKLHLLQKHEKNWYI